MRLAFADGHVVEVISNADLARAATPRRVGRHRERSAI
jgi:hypothetical protein